MEKGCCSTKDGNEDNCCREKGKSRGNRGLYILMALVALLMVLTIFQTYQINAIEEGTVSGAAVSDGSSYADSSEDNERASTTQRPPAMVGGC